MVNLYRDLKTAVIVVVSICLFTIGVDLIFGTAPFDEKFLIEHLLYNAYYGIPLCLGNGWFFAYLNQWIPWDQQPRQRALVGVLGSIVLTMFLLVSLNATLWRLFFGKPFQPDWLLQNRQFFLIALCMTLFVTVVMHAISFFKEVQRERLISSQLRQEKLITELGALRSQVDPHFLFNSFNVLSGLIEEDPQKAQDFLTRLSGIYRYILEQRNDDTSTVADELQFAQHYLSLQQMRFEDAIELQTAISPAGMAKRIPALSLQLLLENAVKHNGFDAEHPLSITISEEQDHLVVRNNRSTRSQLTPGNGMGLQNIRDRYQLLARCTPVIESDERQFAVKLPLL